MQQNFLEHLGNLDIFCLFILGGSGLCGLSRGFLREVISLILWFLAATCGMRGSSFVFQEVNLDQTNKLYSSGVPLLIFVIAMIIFNRLARPSTRLSRDLLSSGLDSVLGMLFGLLRGYIIIILCALFLTWAANDWLQEGLKTSVFAPYIKEGMEFIGGNLSTYFPHQNIIHVPS